MISYRTLNANSSLFARLTCFALLGSLPLVAQIAATQSQTAPPQPLSEPPEARSPIVLTAINDPDTGKAAFSFQGREDPLVIRANP